VATLISPVLQPLAMSCNLECRFSHAIYAQLDQNPARAGVQPSNINGLHVASYFGVEYDAVSMGCKSFLMVNEINGLRHPL
jgi:hypothetical protein